MKCPCCGKDYDCKDPPYGRCVCREDMSEQVLERDKGDAEDNRRRNKALGEVE